jgi:hypothetical protein
VNWVGQKIDIQSGFILGGVINERI